MYDLEKCYFHRGRNIWVTHSCKDEKPKIKESGFYAEEYFNGKCELNNAEISSKIFVNEGFCENSSSKSLFKIINGDLDIRSSYLGYRKKSNIIRDIKY